MNEFLKEEFEDSEDKIADKSFNTIEGKLSIHSNDSIKFMENIGASQHVLNILRNGLLLPLHSTPPPYREDNNKSAKIHSEFLRDKIKTWEQVGYCYQVKSPPHIISPITVSSKLDLATGETKLRDCS